MRLIWLLPLLCSCSFDATGLGGTRKARDGSTTAADGRRDSVPVSDADSAADGQVTGDAELAQDALPEDAPVPDSSLCIFDDFDSPIADWQVTLLRGSDWIWKPPSTARQDKVYYFGAQALVNGSGALVSSFTAETICTVDKVYNNGYGQGAGLSLLIRKVDNNEPYKQVMCLTWMWANTQTAKLTLARFSGTSKSAPTIESKLLGWYPLNDPVTYTMTVTQQGAVWTATCTMTSGANTETVTTDISSYVDTTPLGVALFTAGASADFDQIKVCSGP